MEMDRPDEETDAAAHPGVDVLSLTQELKFDSNGSISPIVTNMTPELWRILRVLGWGCEK